jgi:hypothetical protein
MPVYPPAWNLPGLAIGLSLARTGHAEGTEPTPHLQRHSMPHPQRHSMPVYSTGVESPWDCHRIVISSHRGRTHPNVIPCRCTPPAWNLRRIANGTTKAVSLILFLFSYYLLIPKHHKRYSKKYQYMLFITEIYCQVVYQ